MLPERGSLIAEENMPVEHFAPAAFRGELEVSRVRRIQKENASLAEAIPSPHALRNMNRACLLLCNVVFQYGQKSLPWNENPFRSGLYCAIDSTPIDYERAAVAVTSGNEIFREIKRLFSPKQYLQHLPITSAAQLGIFLGMKGPTNIFNHSVYGVQHALDQARIDLERNVIDYALVCSAFSLEDPLVVWRNRATISPERTIAEGAAYVLLSRNSPNQFDLPKNGNKNSDFYGIADSLVRIALADQTA